MSMRPTFVPVCIANNNLASIYSLMAEGDSCAKFLTSDDLQLFAALISYHYSQDETTLLSNFSVKVGRVSPSSPRFCAVPYKIEKSEFGSDFRYTREYLDEYRRLYHKCITRYGRKWDRDKSSANVAFSKSLASEKTLNSTFNNDLVSAIYESSANQVIDETNYRKFCESRSSSLAVGIQTMVPISNEDKPDWINSQFYILNVNEIDKKEKEKILGEFLECLSQYFETGLPYIFYYQQAKLPPRIGIKLNFDKEKFLQAVKLSIEDFARTSRAQINNRRFEELKSIMAKEEALLDERII